MRGTRLMVALLGVLTAWLALSPVAEHQENDPTQASTIRDL